MEPPYWMVTLRAIRAPYRCRMVARIKVQTSVGLLGGGGLAGADGPDGLIGDDHLRTFSALTPLRAAFTCMTMGSMVTPASRCSRVSPTQMMGMQARLQGGVDNGHAGQLLALQELQGGAAAGGDMGHLLGVAQLFTADAESPPPMMVMALVLRRPRPQQRCPWRSWGTRTRPWGRSR